MKLRKLLQATLFGAVAVTLTQLSCSPHIQQEITFTPAPNSSIVFVGNTLAERMQHYNYFETLLYKSFPNNNLRVRNLGWSADQVDIHTRPLNFPSLDQHLERHKADVIFAFYGSNESFYGPDSLDSFKLKLKDHMLHLSSQKYNGTTSPQVILVSPITHEKLGGYLPTGENENKNLAMYTKAMRDVAKDLNIPFLDILSITEQLGAKSDSITINGIHLNDKGYRELSQYMARTLGFQQNTWSEDTTTRDLKKLIDAKNQQYFYLYRAVNSEYIVGRRKEPWVQPAGGPISYPTELAKLDQMVIRLDSLIWRESNSPDLANLEKLDRILNDTVQYTPIDPQKAVRASASQFILPEGFEINLFASEVDFSIANPVKITFDPQGRLWVGNMQSYPHYLPGAQPKDNLVILEDKDGDGVADQETIFAENLYVPTSFELGKGGVFVSQPPNIWFMRDIDGDGVADQKEIIMHGFGTEDVHHSIDTHTWGPDGALYFHSGTFLHSQVETPYGPVRSDYGTTWRFDPHTLKLEPYVSYPYANPWGHVFLRNGTQLISDVSTGMNYFAPPLSVASEYPIKRTGMKDFLTTSIKPKTCGTEIIASSNFPDEMQGNVLFNTFIGFQGIRQHVISADGSGIKADEIAPLLQSKDPNFRPVDLQFGPDGALYIVDWYNPIINHGERALRDPLRDHTHGRIWRLTYKNKPLVKAVDLTKLPIEQLLQQLMVHEDRTRYRVRTQLRQMSAQEVIPAVQKWLRGLDTSDRFYEQHRMEALWIHQQFNQPDVALLTSLLESKDPAIRTAATRVLFYWKHAIKDTEAQLVALARDTAPSVRLQAIISLSHFKSKAAIDALVGAIPTTSDESDYYIEYALKETFRYTKSIWLDRFKKEKQWLANDPVRAQFLLNSVAHQKDLAVPGFITDDPKWPQYGFKALDAADYAQLSDVPAVADFKKRLDNPAATEPTSVIPENVIRITAVPAKMIFAPETVRLKKGTDVVLEFDNTDGMPHNVVIIKPGTLAKVGKAADAMAASPDGYQKHFVPAISEVLYSTPLVPAGKKHQLKFKAPSAPGKYEFVCTFPGHWQTMKGTIIIE